MARYFGVKPNELANRMIAAGILALERNIAGMLTNSLERRNSPRASIRIRMFPRNWRVMAGPSWVSSKGPIFTAASWSTAF
jgi:hypothetical protein